MHKRALYIPQKSPIHSTKETCVSDMNISSLSALTLLGTTAKEAYMTCE